MAQNRVIASLVRIIERSLQFAGDFSTYLFYLCRRHRALDFVSMGLGIQARFKRNTREWEPHLEQSKRFIREMLERSSANSSVAILGAGRLYDFPIDFAEARGLSLDLFDYDPSLKGAWQKMRSRGKVIRNFYFEDLTGVLEIWSNELRKYRGEKSSEVLAEFLRALPKAFPPSYRIPTGYHCIVSLNILSQLGLYWRDRAEMLLKRHGVSCDGDGFFNEAIEAALRQCSGALERAHLESIERANAPAAIVICDRAYLFYTGDHREWDEHAALTAAPTLNHYSALMEDSWFWHIAPKKRERIGYGEIHEVAAYAYERATRPAQREMQLR